TQVDGGRFVMQGCRFAVRTIPTCVGSSGTASGLRPSQGHPHVRGASPQGGDEVPCRARRRRQCCCPSQGRSTGITLPARCPNRERFGRASKRAFDELLDAGRRHGHLSDGEQPGDLPVGQAGGVQLGEDAGALSAEFVDALLRLLLCGGGRGELGQQVAVLRVDLDHATPSCWRCLAANWVQVSVSTTRVGTARGSPSQPSPTCSPSNTTTCPWSSAGAPPACCWKYSTKSAADRTEE